MSEYYITKEQLWIDAIDTAETLLKTRLVNLERGKDKLTPGERKAVAAMKRKLVSFIKYGEAAAKLSLDIMGTGFLKVVPATGTATVL